MWRVSPVNGSYSYAYNIFFFPQWHFLTSLKIKQANKNHLVRSVPKRRLIFVSISVPEAADSIKTVILSDTTINIYWSEPRKPNGPLESIRYQISVNLLSLVPVTPLRKSEFPNGTLAWSVSGLQSGTNNLFKVELQAVLPVCPLTCKSLACSSVKP